MTRDNLAFRLATWIFCAWSGTSCSSGNVKDGSECGDGIVEGQESCDDGNDVAEDGCNPQCAWEHGWDCSANVCLPDCGDGIVVGNETCDPQATPGYCSKDCTTILGRCGDGVILPDVEVCDPGTGEIRGCSDCNARFGFQCDAAQNTCSASGLPPDLRATDISEEQARQYCEWAIGVLGGEGKVYTCEEHDKVVNTVAACVDEIYPGWHELQDCTIGLLEDAIANLGSPCAVLQVTHFYCPPPEGSCRAYYPSDDSCSRCLTTNCCSEVENCANDTGENGEPACGDSWSCAADNCSDQSTWEDCAATCGDTSAQFTDFVTCVGTFCWDECH